MSDMYVHSRCCQGHWTVEGGKAIVCCTCRKPVGNVVQLDYDSPGSCLSCGGDWEIHLVQGDHEVTGFLECEVCGSKGATVHTTLRPGPGCTCEECAKTETASN